MEVRPIQANKQLVVELTAFEWNTVMAVLSNEDLILSRRLLNSISEQLQTQAMVSTADVSDQDNG